MNQDQIQDAIEDVKTWIGRSPASIDERYYERKAGEAFDSLVEEIERLKCESQKNFMAFTQEAMKSGVRDQETQSLRSQITTLTAERDEAEGKIHSARIFIDALSKYLECGATLENSGNWHSYLQTVANNLNLLMQEACDLRDRYVAERNKAQNEAETLKSDLAALKSCPAMAEVDALQDPWVGQPFLGIIETFRNMRYLARRSISSREEVVGLLKWLVVEVDYGQVKAVLKCGEPRIRDTDKARRILEIVEGK